MIFLCHIISFVLAFALDLVLGDPHSLPHPVRLIGRTVNFFENLFIGKKGSEKNQSAKKKRRLGRLTFFLVCVGFFILTFAIIFLSYKISLVLGCVVEIILSCYLIACKSLKDESMKVFKMLDEKNILGARKALSNIVGRDTQNLNEEQIVKASVETVSENTCDGVIAPLFYLALGGPCLGILYKCINTMDSMIAYKNDRYIDFGRCAALCDDVANFLPARIAALLMCLSCVFLGKDFSRKNAWKIFCRDRFNHESPNSAQCESAAAGALGLLLGGPAFYEGKLEEKKFIGDEKRKASKEDIKKVNVLLYFTAIFFVILCSLFMLIFFSFLK